MMGHQRIRRLRRPAWLGTLRRTTPLSDGFGFDRGTPVDRYFIERFLDENRSAIRGRVLEIKNSKYTQRFGVDVVERDVLDIDPTNRTATIVADLAAADSVPAEAFDCVLLTQTLQYIFDARSAIAHAHRILRPGGTLLCTVPCISRIERGFLDSEHWRFTPASCRGLFGAIFGPEQVIVRTYGNVLPAIAFLMGMASEELRRRELDHHDDHFPVIVAVRAEKAGSPRRPASVDDQVGAGHVR
jgi:SAM-dependent methyltransferase